MNRGLGHEWNRAMAMYGMRHGHEWNGDMAISGAMLVAHSKFRHSHEPKTFSGGTNSARESGHSITPLNQAQPAHVRL